MPFSMFIIQRFWANCTIFNIKLTLSEAWHFLLMQIQLATFYRFAIFQEEVGGIWVNWAIAVIWLNWKHWTKMEGIALMMDGKGEVRYGGDCFIMKVVSFWSRYCFHCSNFSPLPSIQKFFPDYFELVNILPSLHHHHLHDDHSFKSNCQHNRDKTK